MHPAQTRTWRDLGFYTFPVDLTDGFRPLVKWRTESTNDPDKVAVYLHRFQGPYVSMALDCEKSGVAVLDYDPRNDPGGKSLSMVPGLVGTRTHLTPGGGPHFLYRTDELIQSGPLLPGLDLKCKGGAVALPNALRPDGAYQSLSLPGTAPAWLSATARDFLVALQPKQRKTRSGAIVYELPDGVLIHPPTRQRRVMDRRAYIRGAYNSAWKRVAFAPAGESNFRLRHETVGLTKLSVEFDLDFEIARDRLMSAALKRGIDEREAESNIRYAEYWARHVYLMAS